METLAAPLWIFGYGSLMWRPDIPYEEMRIGHIRGWSRRFYQGSTDHRGVPGAPGRVVSLIEETDAVCWGVAFHIPEHQRDSVLANLDHREKGGYVREQLVFHSRDRREIIEVLVYHATEHNPNYLGPVATEDMVHQIYHAHGPSGPNREYLERLAAFLKEHDLEDRHVSTLAARLAEMQPLANGLPG